MPFYADINENGLKDKELQNIECIDAETIAYYVNRGRDLRAQAFTDMFCVMGQGLKTVFKAAYHFSTDWMVNMYRPRTH